MTRSAEAMKRRAEKRNISEQEMRKIDSHQLNNSKKFNESSIATIKKSPKTQTIDDNLSPSSKKRKLVDSDRDYSSQLKIKVFWTCSKCRNKNDILFFSTTCNRCQRARTGELDDYDNKNCTEILKNPKFDIVLKSTSVASEKRIDNNNNTKCVTIDNGNAEEIEFWTCNACANKNESSLHSLTCNQCQRHRSIIETKKVSSNFKNTSSAIESSSSSKSIKVVENDRHEKRRDKKQSDIVSTVVVAENDKSDLYWSCAVCKNRNISAIHLHNCNRCQRHRKEVEVKCNANTTTMSMTSTSALLSGAKSSLPSAPASQSGNVTTTSNTPKTSTRVVTSPTSVTRPSADNDKEVWICIKCKNKNLKSLLQSVCNRCQRPRVKVDVAAKPGEDKDKEDCSPDSSSLSKGNSWSTAAPDKELIERNMKLREDFLNPEVCKNLSEDEKIRAEILIARSKRKQLKKEKRNAWKKKIKKR